jgi:hypothetical protein
MKLLYLTSDNLRNTPFVKELVYHYKDVGKSIILHDHFGSVSDTRFVTKRVSALLSEESITNNAVFGDQRSILRETAFGILIRQDLLQRLLETVDVLVLNALCLADQKVKTIDPIAVAQQLRLAFGLETIHLFARNSRSPMVAMPRHVMMPSDTSSLLEAYEEEAAVLHAASRLSPAVIGSPSNFMEPSR